MILTYIINDMLITKEFYIADIQKKADNIHKKIMLKFIFSNKLYFGSSLINKNKIKVFIGWLYNQASVFY